MNSENGKVVPMVRRGPYATHLAPSALPDMNRYFTGHPDEELVVPLGDPGYRPENRKPIFGDYVG